MASTFSNALRSRSFATIIHIGLWVLVYLALLSLGGKAPEMRDAGSVSVLTPSAVPVAKLEMLFNDSQWPKLSIESNQPSLFFTRFFVPAPSPAPPPAPTTRKLEITYQGFYQAGDSDRHAVVKVADAFVIAKIGGSIATNLFVSDATFKELTLTNPAAQTYSVPFNTKKEIELPLK